jgi:predicted nucleic acid-binding protein
MRVIIDSNILFSALIKNSKTRRLILDYSGKFLFPNFIFTELNKHKIYLLKKSKLSKSNFDNLMDLILSKVEIVPDYLLIPYKKKALEIVQDIDINDVIFFACALSYKNSIIWSNDKRLKSQNIIEVKNTQEIIDILK